MAFAGVCALAPDDVPNSPVIGALRSLETELNLTDEFVRHWLGAMHGG